MRVIAVVAVLTISLCCDCITLFQNTRWVDGELLQFSRNNSPATRNADLGFVWSMPQGSKYLILLNRLDDMF